MAPDGTLYVSDWGSRMYQLHGKGKVWRIRPKVLKPNIIEPLPAPLHIAHDRQRRSLLHESNNLDELLGAANDPDPFIRNAAITGLACNFKSVDPTKHTASGHRTAILLAFKETRKVLDETVGLLTRNRIFTDRMEGTGVISAEDAISYGITGPFLRATGTEYDVRKDCPYAVYDQLPFDVPVGTRGDNMDRYLLRMEEMEQGKFSQKTSRFTPSPYMTLSDERSKRGTVE